MYQTTARKRNPLLYRLVLFFALLFSANLVFAQLSADFTMSKQGGCSPVQISFTSTTRGASANAVYQWDLGNGNSSALQNPGAVYKDEKAYTITLTVKDGAQTSVKTQTVTVYKKPVADFSSNLSKVCLPAPVTFTANAKPGDGSISSYFWDYGDGSTDQTYYGQSSHSFSFTQKPSVSLTVTNTYGCSASITKSGLLEVLPSMQASFSTNKTVLCQISDAVQFTNNSSGPGTLSYSWDFGDGTTSAQKDPQHTYSAKGSYTVKTTVTNTEGCSATNVQTAYINVANFNSQLFIPALICKTNSVYFTGSSTIYPNNSEWDFGDGTVYNNYYWGSVGHAYYNPGTYTVKVTNSFGSCKESVTKQVVVQDIPDLKGFTADIKGNCGAPVLVQFKDTTAGDVKWQWSFDNYYNQNSTAQSPSFTYSSNGYYYVYLTATNAAGCSSSISKAVYINAPSVNISYRNSSSQNGMESCGPLTVTLGYTSSEPLTDFQWNFGDGTTSKQESPVHSWNNPGVYTVRLTYVTASGCKGATDYSAFHVYGKPNANFTASTTTVCGPSPVSFSGSGTLPETYRYWDFGGASYNYYTGYTATTQYADTGTYSIKTIAFNGPCSDTAIKVNYIKVTGPFPSIKGVSYTCSGTRGDVTIRQVTRQATGGTWDFGDGTTMPLDTAQHEVIHTYTKTGSYNVRLTATAGQCAITVGTVVQVLLKQKPVLTLGKTEMCSDETVSASITNYEPNPWGGGSYNHYSFQLKYGDESSYTGYVGYQNNYYYWANQFNGSLTNFAKGEDKIRVITTSYYLGCNDTSAFVPIKVKGANPGFEVIADKVCFKTPVQFRDTSKSYTSTPITSWRWNFGDGQSQTASSGGAMTHKYDNPGNYFVSLTVTDASGCAATSSYYNYAQVNGPKAAFGVSATSISPNSAINFYNYSNTVNSANVEYQWDYGDGATGAGYSGSHVYTVPGSYTVKLIASSASGCKDTATQLINVKFVNSAFNFTSSFISSSKCPPVVVRFNNTSYNGSRFTWDFGDGATLDNQYYTSHVYYNPGKYKVTLTVYSDNGTKYVTVDSIDVHAPAAKMAADILHGCTSQQVTLNAPVHDASTYMWDFGDGALVSSSDTFSIHKYATAGVYSPSLLMTDGNGCTATTSLNNQVIIDSLSLAIKGIPDHICDSATIYFQPDVRNVAGGQGQQTIVYAWDFGTRNTNDVSDLKNPVFSYKDPGTYTVSFQAMTPFGCKKTTTEKVVVYQKATGAINGPLDLCAGSKAQFSGQSTVSDGLTWSWDFFNGNTSGTQNPVSQHFNNEGIYPVQLILKHDGCFDTVIHSLKVHPVPVVQVTASKNLLCLGETVQLNATGGGTYSWQSGSDLSGTNVSNPLASPKNNAVYTVAVTNSFGCQKADSIKLTVVQPFQMKVTADTFVCAGDKIQLHASGASAYLWMGVTQGLDDLHSANPLASPITTTSYTVIGADAFGCFKDTANVKVNVAPLPSVKAEAEVDMLAGDEHQLVATGSNDVTQWMWTPSDYLSCTNCAAPLVKPRGFIDYTVTVKNQYGCLDKDTVHINLQCSQAFVFVPNIFTPNHDGKNDLFYIKGKGVSVIKHFKIYSRWGEVVFERSNFAIDDKSFGWDGTFKGNFVPAGTYVYIAELSCDAGVPFIKKGTITVVY